MASYNSKFYINQKGFIQLYIFFLIIVATTMIVGGGIFLYKKGYKQGADENTSSGVPKDSQISNDEKGSINLQKDTMTTTSPKITPVKEKPSESPLDIKTVITQPPIENSEIKIEKCKTLASAEAQTKSQSAYSDTYRQKSNLYMQHAACGQYNSNSNQTFLEQMNSYSYCLETVTNMSKADAQVAANAAYKATYSSYYLNCLSR